MIILDVNKLTKNFGFGTLFENLSFSLNEGESISIVGPMDVAINAVENYCGSNAGGLRNGQYQKRSKMCLS